MIHSFLNYLHASNDPLFSRMLERRFLAILSRIEIAFGNFCFIGRSDWRKMGKDRVKD